MVPIHDKVILFNKKPQKIGKNNQDEIEILIIEKKYFPNIILLNN